MAVVYIKEQGACIKKHSNRLVIEKDGEVLAELRLIRVTGISVIGLQHRRFTQFCKLV